LDAVKVPPIALLKVIASGLPVTLAVTKAPGFVSATPLPCRSRTIYAFLMRDVVADISH
jgi:hypothetical protein